ncbi:MULTISPECIES: histidine kinase dimerization/phospho-acceptor domain-containing protein [Thiorhodovibrio]|uniref:histidine kinase dimerization/phospho-acceptor domain-containing protein n=1 Tax=Thiorhodovibrio TaxID=61593 RepID=UPI001911A4F0|nr:MULTISPECIES: histidine kinase dimerization/phospho-acceptor domain-containing protein [Thiorhodovibrio]MBK5969164.1 hypothetical protein [Thiorhodovibrio winogradskyi]WPL13364.1 hypothetical protein Thiosp_03165 [Thiorhodovibrio litoralis]
MKNSHSHHGQEAKSAPTHQGAEATRGDDLRQPDGCRVDLECQFLVAEQARDLAHRLRSPLGAIELVCESLAMEQSGSEVAERLQVALRASSKLKQALEETLNNVVPRWPGSRGMDLNAACARLAQTESLVCDPFDPEPIWIAAAPNDGELALWQGLALARLCSRDGQVGLTLAQTPTPTPAPTPTGNAPMADVSFTPVAPREPFDHCLERKILGQGLAHLRLKRLRRFAAEQGGVVQIEPSRLLLRVKTLESAVEPAATPAPSSS